MFLSSQHTQEAEAHSGSLSFGEVWFTYQVLCQPRLYIQRVPVPNNNNNNEKQAEQARRARQWAASLQFLSSGSSQVPDLTSLSDRLLLLVFITELKSKPGQLLTL